MSDWLAIAMLLSGGAGCSPAEWSRLPGSAFPPGTAQTASSSGPPSHTLQRVDRVQPALAVAGLISTIGFAISADGGARALAGLAAAGFGLILVGSGAWLVPLQRRLVARGPEEPHVYTEKLRRQWVRGHQIRAAFGLLTFTLSVVAVAS